MERSWPKAKVPTPTLAAIAISARRLIALIPLGSLSRLAIVELAIENVAEGDILKTVEAPDRIELAHVDVTVCHASRVDVEIDHLADDQGVTVGAKLDHLMELAFEMDRHLFDARRLDLHGSGSGVARFLRTRSHLPEWPLAEIHHLLPHRLRHHVEAELACLAEMSSARASRLPSGLRAMVSEIIGGMTHTTVKNERRQIAEPSALTVEAQPIGRGTTAPSSSR